MIHGSKNRYANRQPIEMERIGGQDKCDRIWQQIRLQRQFSIRTLFAKLPGISNTSIKKYVVALCRGGYLQATKENQPIKYQLIKDCGIDAPRLRADGSKVIQGAANENMWRTAKILKSFDWLELMRVASTEEVMIKESTVKRYILNLHRGRYLFCIRKAKRGVKAVYRFNPAMNTGQRAPKIQRDKSLYDPNLDQIVFSKKGKHHE